MNINRCHSRAEIQFLLNWRTPTNDFLIILIIFERKNEIQYLAAPRFGIVSKYCKAADIRIRMKSFFFRFFKCFLLLSTDANYVTSANNNIANNKRRNNPYFTAYTKMAIHFVSFTQFVIHICVKSCICPFPFHEIWFCKLLIQQKTSQTIKRIKITLLCKDIPDTKDSSAKRHKHNRQLYYPARRNCLKI